MAPKRTYRLADPISDSAEKELREYSALTKQLLYNRGVRETDAAMHFLTPDYIEHLHDPFLMTDMERAVERILSAMEAGERIGIFSDYDCDGIPGGVILHDFFTEVEHLAFTNYIPHRHYEGFGFSAEGAEKLNEKGATLIITVDCGTVNHDAIDHANECGIDVIVTDHHQPEAKLPAAYAILNPARDDAYPFQGLCGAGVVYKLVQALIARGTEKKQFEFSEGKEKWLLDMVGLATIADMVPLQGENRALAHYGLKVLRKSRRPGLQHLLRKARANQTFLTEDDIGFTIGPRINAASRMDTPEDAFMMLATKDEVEAGARVAHLEKLNNERKGIVASMTKELKKRMDLLEEVPDVIVMGNPDWRPALVGLTANALVETYKRPAFVWGRDGKGVIKGSCRSHDGVSALHLMEEAKSAFLEFGGHHASGGFSVSNEQIHSLADALNDAFATVSQGVALQSHETVIDAEISLDDIDEHFMRSLQTLAPYGVGNHKPVFQCNDVVPDRVELFGKTKEHTKMIFTTKNGPREAIAFFRTPESFGVSVDEMKPLTLIAHVEESFFMGRRSIRLRIVDVL